MFLISLLRPVQSWLLTTKRLLFRESAEVIQYYQGAVESLQEQFQQLSRRPQIAKSQVEELFKAKKDLIAERFNHFASFHKNDPKTKEKVDRYKDEIIGKLQTLETNVTTDLNALFNSKTSEIYLNRHGDRYRQILQAHQLLSGQTPTNPTVTSTPQVASPQRPKPLEVTPSPATGTAERAPLLEVSGEKLALATLTIAGLFQNIPTAKYRPPFSLERKEVNKTFDSLSKNWGDVDPRFSEEFLTHIGNTPGNISFLKKAVQHPQQLKDLVQALYGSYQEQFRVSSPTNMRSFFTGLGSVELSAETVKSAHGKLLKAIIPEIWDDVLKKTPERLTTGQEREVLLGLNKALHNRRFPVWEQLRAVQSMVRFIETNIIKNGERLKWKSVLESKIQAEEVFQKQPDGSSTLVKPRTFSLQGKEIGVRNVESRTVCSFEGQDFEFDLPHLLETLKKMHQQYHFVFENDETVNLGLLVHQVDKPQNQEFIDRINRERYLALVKSFGMQSSYEDFNGSLRNLLDVRDPNEKKTPAEWVEKINKLQISRDENPLFQDKFRFITLVRTYLNTRSLSNQSPMTLSEFANHIMKAGINVTIISPDANSNNMFREMAERKLIPAITEIYEFFQLFPSTHADPQTRDSDPSIASWHKLVIDLNLNEISWLTSNFSVTNKSSSHSMPLYYLKTKPEGATHYIIPEIIEKYHHLKLQNPLFQEIVAIGEKGSSTATFMQIMNSIFGPINISTNKK